MQDVPPVHINHKVAQGANYCWLCEDLKAAVACGQPFYWMENGKTTYFVIPVKDNE